MKHNANSLIGFSMGATDGEIGTVKEFYFDDKTWTIRYLIVETGSWFVGREVLISPRALLAPDWERKVFPVNLFKEQIKNSPEIDTDKPVSQQKELDLSAHYSSGPHWGSGFFAGGMRPPVSMYNVILGENKLKANAELKGDAHLRSTKVLTGYKIKADYGEIGNVEDFLVDEHSWKIDFIVVDTGDLLPGKKVLISPDWIKEISWENSSVTVNATVDTIKNSPEYDHAHPISDAYSKVLHKYYTRPAF